jgi:hypothetical protein
MGCRAALLPAYADQRLVTRTDNRACGLLVKHLRIHNRVLTPSVAADEPTTADHYLHFPGNVNRPELRYFRLAPVGLPSVPCIDGGDAIKAASGKDVWLQANASSGQLVVRPLCECSPLTRYILPFFPG